MAANVLRHERFERVPAQPRKRRRGPLPRGVTHISHAPRIRDGVIAEMIGRKNNKRNAGIRVSVVKFDASSQWCWAVKSLGRPIACNSGEMAVDGVWCRDRELRRLWRGLSENDRIKLRMWRAS